MAILASMRGAVLRNEVFDPIWSIPSTRGRLSDDRELNRLKLKFKEGLKNLYMVKGKLVIDLQVLLSQDLQ